MRWWKGSASRQEINHSVWGTWGWEKSWDGWSPLCSTEQMYAHAVWMEGYRRNVVLRVFLSYPHSPWPFVHSWPCHTTQQPGERREPRSTASGPGVPLGPSSPLPSRSMTPCLADQTPEGGKGIWGRAPRREGTEFRHSLCGSLTLKYVLTWWLRRKGAGPSLWQQLRPEQGWLTSVPMH